MVDEQHQQMVIIQFNLIAAVTPAPFIFDFVADAVCVRPVRRHRAFLFSQRVSAESITLHELHCVLYLYR